MNAFVYQSTSHDPFFNMAIENALLKNIGKHQIFLFLYQNQKSIIIGRNQNPWQQAFLNLMEKDNIILCRRESGGGAVYQDEGNLNFCFISYEKSSDKENNLKLILSSLKRLNISAQMNSRHDLFYRQGKNNFKFSGSAFRQHKNLTLHHGTLLINSDLVKLKLYLTPPTRRWQGNAVLSTPSKVINLKSINQDINVDTVKDCLINSFFNNYKQEKKIEILDEYYLPSKEFKNYYDKIKNTKWRLGGGPPITQIIKKKVNNSYIQCLLEIKRGEVHKVQLLPKRGTSHKVEELLRGRIYHPEEIDQLLNRHLTF